MDTSSSNSGEHVALRAGTVHKYELTEKALRYTAGTRTAVSIPWSDITNVVYRNNLLSRDGLVVLAKDAQPLIVFTENPKQAETFLESLFTRWSLANRENALRTAANYSRDRRALGWVWIACGLAFPGALSFLLLADAISNTRCSEKLRAEPVVTAAEVLKVSKNRRSNFVWRLKFTAPNGAIVEGKRTPTMVGLGGLPPSADETAVINGLQASVSQPNISGGKSTKATAPQPAPGTTVPVIVAASDESCWEIGASPNDTHVNWSQRRFTEINLWAFGLAFLVVSLGICLLGFLNLRYRAPGVMRIARWIESQATKQAS